MVVSLDTSFPRMGFGFPSGGCVCSRFFLPPAFWALPFEGADRGSRVQVLQQVPFGTNAPQSTPG